MSEVTLFWSLYNAGLNGDFGAAADMFADEREYVMMPTMEVARGKPAVLNSDGARVRERLIEPAHRRSPSMLLSQNGVSSIVKKAPSPAGSSISLRALTGSFQQSPAPSSDARAKLPSAWCTT